VSSTSGDDVTGAEPIRYRPTAQSPTVVLVHGGTFTSRMWDGVREHLRSPSLAVDLPGRRYKPADLGVVKRQDWVDSVICDIQKEGLSDVVLVGHSSGGYVIPGVATGLGAGERARVRSLVFVAATVPAEGKRPVDFLRPDLRTLAVETTDVVILSAKGRTLGGFEEDEHPVETNFEIVENGPRMGLEAPGPLFDSFSWKGFPSHLPRYFVRCTRDKVIPPELVEVMIDNMGGATVIDLYAGHSAARTHPQALAAAIDQCVESTVAQGWG